jgi:hypothetical protein
LDFRGSGVLGVCSILLDQPRLIFSQVALSVAPYSALFRLLFDPSIVSQRLGRCKEIVAPPARLTAGADP